jgi:hypothetical protein
VTLTLPPPFDKRHESERKAPFPTLNNNSGKTQVKEAANSLPTLPNEGSFQFVTRSIPAIQDDPPPSDKHY